METIFEKEFVKIKNGKNFAMTDTIIKKCKKNIRGTPMSIPKNIL